MNVRVFVLGLAIAVLATGALMRWDNGRAAAVDGGNETIQKQMIEKQDHIPEDAIRLRILANSDSDNDQRVKRIVRDRIVEQMNGWLKTEEKPSTREEARKLIAAHINDLKQTAERVLGEEGLAYGAKVKLGEVSFPAKWYGGEVYPAGLYEALLVTLGEGSGQNWWCVLFPPLCFVDGNTAQAQVNEGNSDETASTKGGEKDKSSSSSVGESVTVDAKNSTGAQSQSTGETGGTEVKFFLWEALEALFHFIGSIFGAIFG
ncbi:stage II sporulation protein R [Paenibacillus alvei]|uniref:stage II sporulation protein R n=1 Tax=Paenibacillus alvei TaxID=44250 RepID=UPI0013DD059F|nr:stage II sporulation protein R [Paenibacillus alvei]MBG9735127.1 stage II sporulation protein R [Paenibacillus alvei]MBG9743585.1 stage II sporulation protein R [Paenibacillus alvei]MCY9579980.1 stage II sporulation protein R [Paenibacillus alvei]MCY9584156.1 stage II sporulation protein R [Paenibacillus alvei]NEZ43430.1 stage II sporulation protein R [Paenibacillus alvei]